MYRAIKSFINNFKNQCPATKTIILVALICLCNTALSLFLSSNPNSPSDIAIRSVMSSILGYVLGEHCQTNKIGNNKIQTIFASIIALISLTTQLILSWTNGIQVSSAAVEMRNVLFSSVGFLISTAKNDPPKC